MRRKYKARNVRESIILNARTSPVKQSMIYCLSSPIKIEIEIERENSESMYVSMFQESAMRLIRS